MNDNHRYRPFLIYQPIIEFMRKKLVFILTI